MKRMAAAIIFLAGFGIGSFTGFEAGWLKGNHDARAALQER